MNFAYSSATLGNLKEVPEKEAKERLYFGFTLADSENRQLDNSATIFLETEINKVDKSEEVQFRAIVRNCVSKFKVLDLGAVLLINNKLYAAVLGKVDIKILRNQKLINLCSGGNNVTFLSGNLLVKDVVIMASKNFYEKFSEPSLTEVLNNGLETGLTKPKSFFASTPANDLNAFFVELVSTPSNLESAKTIFLKGLGLVKKSFEKLIFLVPRKLYVSRSTESLEDSEPKSKVSGSVGVILISLLVISILFGAVRKNQLQVAKNETEVASLVEHKVSEAQSIYLLNPTRSRELINEARASLDNHKKSSRNIDELIKKVEEAEQLILGDYKKDPQLFFDLTLFSEGFRSEKVESFGNYLYVFDKNAKKIVSIDIESKRSEVVAGPSLIGDAREIIPVLGKVLYLKADGVYELDGKKLIEKNFDGEVLITHYLGNLYLLDKKSSQILRFTGAAGSFGAGVSWLTDGENLNLTGASDMVADGFLWVLLNDREIIKLSQGKKVKFSVKGFDFKDFSTKTIYTNPDLKYLYLVDTTNGKIMVIGKDGEYRAQYSSEKLIGTIGLVVHEKNKKAYFLTGEKLLYLDLEHL